MSSLISKAKLGDREALSTLVNNHKEFAFNLALNLVKDNNDAKDIAQQSFLKVLENISKFRSESKFSTWLYRIVYNESMTFLKRKSKTVTKDIKKGIQEDEVYMFGESDKETLYNDLHKSILKLNPNEKMVIMLFYLSGKSINEITKITGFSQTNVKVLMHRSRKKLKDIITDKHERR